MKKKILFVNKSFQFGGIQSSLNNLLNIMSKEENLEIDVLVFNPQGNFKKNVPENVRIIEPSLLVRTMGMTLSQTMNSKNLILIAYKIISTVWAKFFGNSFPVWFALLFQKKLRGYDYAFAYHHEVSKKTTVTGFSRFILKKCDAKCKVSWIHTDIINARLNTEQNRKIYKNLDRIIAVSQGVKTSFVKAFPEYESKTSVIYNFHQFDKILKMSEQDTVIYNHDVLNFLTVARLSKEKGHIRTINIFERLKNEGYKFYWHLVGGSDRETEDNFKKIILDKGLADNIIMYGVQSNPYRFFADADCLISPSYNEAAPMVFSEAECLKLPIIATETSSAKELISDKNIGVVCDNTDEELYNAIKNILDNPEQLQEYQKILDKSHFSAESKKDFLSFLDELI